MKDKKPRDPRPIKEAQVLTAVKALLEAKGFRIWRRNVAAFAIPKTRKHKRRFIRAAEPGQVDLWGWARRDQNTWSQVQPFEFIRMGQHIEVEIKAPGKKPTELQQDWLAQAEKEGCIAFWCDSTDMAEAKLKEWGL